MFSFGITLITSGMTNPDSPFLDNRPFRELATPWNRELRYAGISGYLKMSDASSSLLHFNDNLFTNHQTTIVRFQVAPGSRIARTVGTASIRGTNVLFTYFLNCQEQAEPQAMRMTRRIYARMGEGAGEGHIKFDTITLRSSEPRNGWKYMGTITSMLMSSPALPKPNAENLPPFNFARLFYAGLPVLEAEQGLFPTDIKMEVTDYQLLPGKVEPGFTWTIEPGLN